MSWSYEVKEDGLTVEELLRSEWGLGKKIVHEMRMAKSVKNDKFQEVIWREPLEKGTVLHFDLPPAVSPYEPKHDVELPILFEDEHFIIANKPKGMKTHPNEVGQIDTFINAILGHIVRNGGSYGEHVHRLDQGTSGLLMVAKHPVAKNVLDRMLEQKQLVRDYEAVVKGRVREKSGTIDAKLGRDRHHATRRIASPTGQSAVTYFKVVKQLDSKSILHLTLETGRTHQIRAHLAHLGHPIIGDELYGGPPTQDGAYHLHAFRMSFIHPFTGEKIVIEDTSR
ncbi:RluA family pseudouridine synthase [Planococcus sp. N028]|uniref:Pseudouridine synthase n=1 Tax=Planococcus shixiaomingii TaxID=3058393 RepID=A0ABT8N6A7_9BACL|nr:MULTISPECIES: RluA family pseudouridine synthase [unclassified Planococcus (in: firmicutes)]MDN7243421.1 RluA family pseudouridine synthase [Planococcus sp. N028]WKA55868.1 RluA family pseudouridine synthase [Planococcus sp. N022]